jgi:hypothetical protein
VVGLQSTFLQKLFNVPKRQRIPKVPADGAENEDSSVCRHLKIAVRVAIFRVPSGYQTRIDSVATQPFTLPSQLTQAVIFSEPLERESRRNLSQPPAARWFRPASARMPFRNFKFRPPAIAPSFDARLEVNDRTQAVVIAAQRGILEI